MVRYRKRIQSFALSTAFRQKNRNQHNREETECSLYT